MVLPRMPEAVVFDMDGLLFDTETLYRDAIMAAAAEDGIAMTLEVFQGLLGSPWPANRQSLLDHFGADFPVDALRDGWMRHFAALVETRLALKPGVAELLDTLDALGIRRAIATSSRHRDVARYLEAHRLQGRFHAVIAHGDYAAGKPAPDPFLRAAERLGADPAACLALEDSFNGIRSAAAAGMVAVMVPDLLAPTEEIRGLCTLVVPDLHAVCDLVRAASAGASGRGFEAANPAGIA